MSKIYFQVVQKRTKIGYVSISVCKSMLLRFSKSVSAFIHMLYMYMHIYICHLPISVLIYVEKEQEKYTKDILLSTSLLIVKYSMLLTFLLLLQKHSSFFSNL